VLLELLLRDAGIHYAYVPFARNKNNFRSGFFLVQWLLRVRHTEDHPLASCFVHFLIHQFFALYSQPRLRQQEQMLPKLVALSEVDNDSSVPIVPLVYG
jgi:hypothetical protein